MACCVGPKIINMTCATQYRLICSFLPDFVTGDGRSSLQTERSNAHQQFWAITRAWRVGYRDGTGSENLRVTNHTPVQSFSSLTSSHSLLWNRDRNKKDHLCSAKIQFQVSACILLFHVTCDSLTHWLTAWLTPAIWLESSYFGDLGSLAPLGPMCLW